jgi:hypothetical protein
MDVEKSVVQFLTARDAARRLGQEYGVGGIRYEDTIRIRGEKDKALGHVVCKNIFSGKVIDQFMDATDNESVTFYCPLLSGEGDEASFSIIAGNFNDMVAHDIVQACRDNVFIYRKGRTDQPEAIRVAEINGRMFKSGRLEELTLSEFIATTGRITVKNALARVEEIDEAGILNYDLINERTDIERRLKTMREDADLRELLGGF